MNSTQPRANPAVSALIVIVTLLIVCGVLIAAYAPAREFASRAAAPFVARAKASLIAARLPADLRTAYFITPNGAYRATHFDFMPATLPGTPAAVTKVYSFPFNANTQKANPRVSPDGTYVAFQQLSSSDHASSTAGWQVSIAIPATTAQYAVGKGVQPFFIDHVHLAFFTPEGLVVRDPAATSTATSTNTVVINQPFASADALLSLSPNDSLVALADASTTNRVIVYAVTPTHDQLVATYQGPYTSVALSNAALYIVNASANGTRIDQLDLRPNATPQTVTTLPAAFGVTALRF